MVLNASVLVPGEVCWMEMNVAVHCCYRHDKYPKEARKVWKRWLVDSFLTSVLKNLVGLVYSSLFFFVLHLFLSSQCFLCWVKSSRESVKSAEAAGQKPFFKSHSKFPLEGVGQMHSGVHLQPPLSWFLLCALSSLCSCSFLLFF